MQELMIKSFDDTQLFMRIDEVDNPKGMIVIVHGLSESCDRYRHLISFFNNLGYGTVSFDNRGNARSGGPTGDCNSFMDFIEDTHLMVNLAKKYHQKVYLLGHSLGGFIVNAYVCKYQDIAGVISSGAVGIYLKQVKAFKIIPFKPFKKVWIKNNLAHLLCHDDKVIADYLASPYVNKKNRVNLIGECFIKGVKFLQKNYHHYVGPILYLHGEDDQIVDVKSSEFLYKLSQSPAKEIHLYPGLFHEIFNEPDNANVLDDLKGWLLKHE